jgi:hypothetical protein
MSWRPAVTTMDMRQHGLGRERWITIGQVADSAGRGDCARMVWRDDGRALFFIGDVAGHDGRAAELAAQLDDLVAELAAVVAPAELLTRLNAAIEACWPADVFVCATCFVLDPKTGRGTVAAAGQLPPVIRGASSCRALDVDAGPALGLIAKPRYAERDFTLGAGEILVAVTDGVTDPLATRSDPLGLGALARLVDGAPLAPSDLCSFLINITRRRGGDDDATVVTVTSTPSLHVRSARASLTL